MKTELRQLLPDALLAECYSVPSYPAGRAAGAATSCAARCCGCLHMRLLHHLNHSPALTCCPGALLAGGGKDLEEPLVVRPTSETIVNHMFAQVGGCAPAMAAPGAAYPCQQQAAAGVIAIAILGRRAGGAVDVVCLPTVRLSSGWH